MDFISATGTGSAAPTRGSGDSALNRIGRRLGAALIIVGILPGAAGSTDDAAIDVTVEGLRSTRGTISACLTTHADHFPDCRSDPQARNLSVPAGRALLRFTAVPAGDYALAIIHDENGNAKLDTFAGIPREGIGFSRNPKMRFGPPAFTAANFAVGHAQVKQQVRMRYFL